MNEILLIVAASFLSAIVSGLAGFAFALVGLATFAQFLPPLVSVPLILALSAAAQLFALVRVRRAIDWPRLLPFVIAGIPGVPIGTYALLVLSADWFAIATGLFLVVYATWGLAGFAPRVVAGGAAADGAIGFIGGVLGGAAALSGAIPTIWTQIRGWSKDEARAVYQPYILVLQIVALASAWAGGAIHPAAYRAIAWGLPATALGVAIGLLLYARVDDRQFRIIVQVLLLLSGLALLVPRVLA